MSNSAAVCLRKDYTRIMRDPVPFITAAPHPANILEWHYVVRGPPNTPYAGGVYHGKLVFPAQFPFKPPSIYMLTPNGRFHVNSRLCLSISDFHPDTWNPAWSVSTILTGLLSFMLETSPTYGSIESTEFEKKRLARCSWDFNLKTKMFCDLFPDIVTELKQKIADEQAAQQASQNAAGGNSPAAERTAAGLLDSPLTNLLVLVGVAVFAYVVRYVVNSAS